MWVYRIALGIVLVAAVEGRAQESAEAPVAAPAATAEPSDAGPAAAAGQPGDAPAAERAGGSGGVSAGGGTAVSGNPAAVNILSGTGALGRRLGIPEDSGIRLGGLWVGDASGVLSGGASPGRWGLNGLAIANLSLDAEKRYGWKGSSFAAEFLQFNGQPTNALAGALPGFDSLEAGPPLNRSELYQLWYRQALFDDKLIFRIGKSVPTFDFNNVVKPVPVGNPSAAIPAVSSLIYTPVFVNPTLLGVIPGYYNSATGITTSFAPTKNVYASYGFYDGNVVRGRQTGFEGPHFNGYYFHIGEVGASYLLGRQRKPGSFGVGVWGQTGRLAILNARHATGDGAIGTYLFGSQRLWFRNPGVDSSGVSGFYQFGANNSNALLARYYVGGGLTAFGLVPGRPDDSFGGGIAWTALTPTINPAADLTFDALGGAMPSGPPRVRSNQLMLAAYYQMKVARSSYFQTTLTDIPNPGLGPYPNALALTFRVIVLF